MVFLDELAALGAQAFDDACAAFFIFGEPHLAPHGVAATSFGIVLLC